MSSVPLCSKLDRSGQMVLIRGWLTVPLLKSRVQKSLQDWSEQTLERANDFQLRQTLATIFLTVIIVADAFR